MLLPRILTEGRTAARRSAFQIMRLESRLLWRLALQTMLGWLFCAYRMIYIDVQLDGGFERMFGMESAARCTRE
jgi:hypothetical protein